MYTIRDTQLAPVEIDAGQRRTTRLQSGVQTHMLTLDITATESASAGAIRNRGSVLAAFEQFGLDENGDERWNIDPRVLGFLNDCLAPSAPTRTRLTAVGAGPVTLRETILMPFAPALQLIPRETAFLERDARRPLDFFARMHSTPGERIAAGGATLADVTIDVVQTFDPHERKRPMFVPTVREHEETISGASTRHPIYLRPNGFLRGLIIQQETTDVGEVSDIINALRLRGDIGSIIGPELVDFDLLVRKQEYEFGGAVGPDAAAGGQSYLFLNFAKHGRLSSVLNPGHDLNLRLELDCQPSASAGTSRVRVTMLELEHPAGATDINGTALVSPISFPI